MILFYIQPANPKNAADIARVHVDTWRTTYAGIVPDDHLASLSYDVRTKLWTEILSDPALHHHTWVAKDAAGKVVGFSNGGKNRDESQPYQGEVMALYLLKEFQGRGIGKRLLLDSFEQLFRHGHTSAIAWVFEKNPTAQFYERLGGKLCGEKWDDFGGTRLKEVAYGWPDILASLKEHRPSLGHPSIKHFSELQEADGWNHYPDSTELHSIGSPLAKTLGLKRMGIHHELLPPGRRTSFPHAEQDEEELIYVIEGTPEVWIDGKIYPLKPGDAVGFPCGTGANHTFINNSDKDARLLVVGEAGKKTSLIYYPLNPSRKAQVPESWWHNVPQRPMGNHDGKPDALK